MPKYLLLWEIDQNRVPIAPKDRAASYKVLTASVKDDFSAGTTKDWGGFAGENNGYAVFEGTHLQLGLMMQKYIPWVIFKTHEISSLEDVNEMLDELSKL